MILKKRSLQKRHLLKLYSPENLPLLSTQVGYFSCLMFFFSIVCCIYFSPFKQMRACMLIFIMVSITHIALFVFWTHHLVFYSFFFFCFSLSSIGGIPCVNEDGKQFNIKKYDKSIQQSLNLDYKFLPCSIVTWRYVPLSSLIIDNYFP